MGSFICLSGANVWIWSSHSSGLFSVSSGYQLLSHSMARVLRLSNELVDILNKVWKIRAPYKVCAFSWQLLVDRVSTRKNLFSRRVITDVAATVCILYQNAFESSLHLFCIYIVLLMRFGMSLLAGWVLTL